ncbi:hypothetical protein EO763_09930 [Pectobacterium odoriferum]|uniref:hypothetical protein n=1 Tax=Pectobacterium odoriferum TaxID=78398 RepID=UPI001373CAFE|nr:hypothetical protein [Pectobacterium odoriferum]QHP80218.1 hypothetical protein EO763_09930 [Pectobacterium odoriferum]
MFYITKTDESEDNSHSYNYCNGWSFIKDNCQSISIGNESFLLFGIAQKNNNPLKISDYVFTNNPLSNIEKDLKSCNGYFCFIHISDSVSIYTSLYCCMEIFYFVSDGECIITSDYRMLIQSSKSTEIDINYCNHFINNKDGLTDLTFYKKLKKVHSGTVYKFNKNGGIEINSFFPEKTSLSITDIIKEAVEIISKKHSDINLFLSGGLDSTVLFLSLKESEIDFTCYNIAPYEKEKEIDSEIEDVKYLCNKYNVSNYILSNNISIVSNPFNKDSNINSPNYIKINEIETINNNEYIKKSASPLSLFISGHGGDSVFVQNPSSRIVKDCILRLKPFLALIKARELSMLKGRSLFEIFAHAFSRTGDTNPSPVWIDELPIINDCIHPWIKNENKNTIRYQYIKDLIILISGSQFLSHNSSSCIYPYLFNKTISYQLNFPYELTFNRYFDRANIREEAMSKYNCSLLYKKKKRSSSVLLFSLMVKNVKFFKEILYENKDFLDKINVNYDSLIESIDYNSKISIQHDHYNILRLIKLTLYKKILEGVK